jgi:two-component system chemotaxis sensor kinase CheA
LTLAIIDGFQVSVGDRSFIVPLDMVVECIELPAGVRTDYLDLRGEVLPFVRLRTLFEVEGPRSPRRSVVVVRFAGRKVGLEVDRLHGECQTVIKPLGRLFERLNGISGSTILGSGAVALILDVPHLIQHAMRRETQETGSVSNA